MFVRVFEGDLLIRKVELKEGETYRVGSDNQCEIKLSGTAPLEGEIVWKDGKWFYKKVKEKEGLELSPGMEVVVGDYKLRFAEPVFGAKTPSDDRTVVYQMNDATIVVDRGAKPKLIFLDGEFKGKEVSIDKPIFTIGRVAGNDLVIPHPSVSKQHCRIVKKGDSYIVEDFGSTNGTFVNGEKVEKSRELKSGDNLDVGLAKLQFWLGESVYAPGKPGDREVTVVKSRKINGRVVALVVAILILLGVILFMPSGKKRKNATTSPPVVPTVTPTRSVEKNNEEPPPAPAEPETEEKTSPQETQQQAVTESHENRVKKTEKESSAVPAEKKTTLRKKRKTGRHRKNSTSAGIVKWWTDVPCNVVWQNSDSARKVFRKAPDLRKKVYTCGEVEIKGLLDKQDFQGALRVYNYVKKISGKVPDNLVRLFDDAVKKIYRQGYLLEDVDPEAAREIYRRVIRITPPESDYHRKAEARLQ